MRASRTPTDMAKALLVLFAPVAVLVTLYVFFFGGNDAIAIDPSGTYAAARASGQFTVLEPVGLSTDWKPVSSSYQGGVLRVGYITPSGAGIQLVESKQDLIASEIGSAPRAAIAIEAGDLAWGRLTVPDKSDQALVNTDAARTVIISGAADFDELTSFAASLA